MERMQWHAQDPEGKTSVPLYVSGKAGALLEAWLAGPVATMLAGAAETLGTDASQGAGPMLVATMSPAARRMLDDGQWMLRPDRQGMILPALVDDKGLIREQVRLEEHRPTAGVGPVLSGLMLQATLSLVLERVEDMRRTVERVARDMVEQRLADAAWCELAAIEAMDEGEDKHQRLNQAWSDAVKARCRLQGHWANCRQDLLDGHDEEQAAVDMIRGLLAIARCAQVEMATNAMIDQTGPQYVCLAQLAEFVTDNGLDKRDTLLQADSAIAPRRRTPGLCDGLYAMCRSIVALDAAAREHAGDSEHDGDGELRVGQGLPVSWDWAQRALECVDIKAEDAERKRCPHCHCTLPSWQTGRFEFCRSARRAGSRVLGGVLGAGALLLLAGRDEGSESDEDDE